MAKIKVDMTGVEAFVSCAEGEHIGKIVDAELKDTNNGDDMIILKFEVVSGPSKGSRVKENFPLTDNARWKLKQLLDAIGMKSDGKLVIDTDKLMDKRVIIEVALEEYNGKKYPKIQEFRKLSSKAAAASEDEDEDEEEEAPKSKKPVAKPTAKPSKKPVDDDEDEDEEDDEPVVKKTKKPEPKPTPKKKPVVEEDDEDEEDEEPVSKKPVSKKPDPKAEKAKAKKKPPVDDDDDEEWDEED